MNTAEFWLPVVVLFATAYFAYINYAGMRRGEWRWWWVLVSLCFIVTVAVILYPTYDLAKRRRIYGPHRSHVITPTHRNKQHNKALHLTGYSAFRASAGR